MISFLFLLLLLLYTLFTFSSPTFSYEFQPSIHTTTGPERDESRDITDAGAWMWFCLFREMICLACNFLIVDLIRRCIGGVRNGAVDDRKQVWFYIVVHVALCLN